MTIFVEVMRGRSHLESLAEDWRRLLPSERWRVFVDPVWCGILWDTVYAGATVTFHVARMEGRIVGILPVVHRRMNKYGLFLRVDESFGGLKGDYSDLVVDRQYQVEVTHALASSALEETGRSDSLTFAYVPERSEALRGILSAVEASRSQVSVGRTFCPTIGLSGTVEETEARLPKRLRSDIKRCERKLEAELGPLRFEVFTEQAVALTNLPRLYEMHDRRWTESGSPGHFSNPRVRRFYERLVTDFWDRGVHFSALFAGERPIAYHFGYVSEGALLYYKPAFDSSLGRYSPGKVHLLSLLRHGVQQGWHLLDMLQGAEGYKDEWATEATGTRTVVVRTRTIAPAYFWSTLVRPALEKRGGRLLKRVAAKLSALRARTND